VLETVHILCAVHDAAVVQRLSREMDDGEHCLFDIVRDGASALRYCQAHMPDILVLDAVLPVIDGLGVMDCLHTAQHSRMPRVIGGSVTRLSEAGFLSRGAQAVVHVPWNAVELRAALHAQMEAAQSVINWQELEPACQMAEEMLRRMGMNAALKGATYLAPAAALAFENESRLNAVGKCIYEPIAVRWGTTPQCVERLIRHAVESTMGAAQARGVYSLFGNTIDPARGKPTNAQIIALLAQRMRVSEETQKH